MGHITTGEGTSVPDWVAVSGVSPTAHSLYGKILMSSLADVTVTADNLAFLLGLSRADKLGPYIKELQAIGAADVRRVGVPGRNVYTAAISPPSWYEGPVSFSEWLACQQGEIVYYVRRQTDRAIKIGYTADRITIRMSRFRRDHGDVHLVGFEPGGFDVEGRRHAQFSALRILDGDRGAGSEWFTAGAELERFLFTLAGAR